MAWNSMVLVGLLVCVKATDKGFLCPIDFCTNEQPFCFNFQCFSVCPSNTYAYQRNCMPSCPDGLVADEQLCVDNCPAIRPQIQDGHCREACNSDKVLVNASNTCANECPEGTFLFNMTCSGECPDDYQLVLRKKILVTSEDGSFRHFQANACVNKCPETTIQTNTSCVLSCPPMMVLFNQTCVQRCPPSHSYVMIKETDVNSIPVCVTSCPQNLYVDGKLCTSKCLNGRLVSNNTCVSNCSDPFPLLCQYGKCDQVIYMMYFDQEGLCLPTCPPYNFKYHNECFSSCHAFTPAKYQFNGTCVEACPFNLSYQYNCVLECPSNLFRNVDSCVNYCPIGMISYNGTCYLECPESAPFKQTSSTYGRFWIERSSRITCSRSCPTGTNQYKKQCVKKCPKEWPLFNSTCMQHCPSSHPLFYSKSGTLECISTRPKGSYEYNGTLYNTCPSHAGYVFNGSCYVICPEAYPYVHVESDISGRQTMKMCRRNCVKGTFLVNTTCQAKCPAGFFVMKGTCVRNCSTSYQHVSLKSSPARTNELHCVAFCSSNSNLSGIEPCLFNSSTELYFADDSCNQTDHTKDYECSPKVFESNGTFYQECPKNLFYFQMECVQTCPQSHRFYEPESRLCISRCPEKLLTFKSQCLQKCPKGTNIIDKVCEETKECPSTLPLSYNKVEGTYCLKECPKKYFQDESTCVEKCSGKKVVGRTCTKQCPPSHPFYKKGVVLDDIPECFDVCPDSDIGMVTTFECISDYDCQGYVYEKKCFSQCPAFTYMNQIDGVKKCYDIGSVQLRIAICVLVSVCVLVFYVSCVCLEKGTIEEKISKLTGRLKNCQLKREQIDFANATVMEETEENHVFDTRDDRTDDFRVNDDVPLLTSV